MEENEDPLDHAQRLLDEINSQTDPFKRIEILYRLTKWLIKLIRNLPASNNQLIDVIAMMDQHIAERKLLDHSLEKRLKNIEELVKSDIESRQQMRMVVEDIQKRIMKIEKEKDSLLPNHH